MFNQLKYPSTEFYFMSKNIGLKNEILKTQEIGVFGG